MRFGVLKSQFHSLLVALWLTLSIAGVAMAALTWQRLAHSVDEAVGLATINEAVGQVLALLQDAETGQRGFTITGFPEYLEPYEAARKRLPDELQALTELAMNDLQLRRDLVDLRVLAEVRINQLQEIIDTRKDMGFPAAAALIGTHKGKETMDRIRALVTKMRGERLKVFAANVDRTRQQLDRASLTSLVAGLLGVGAGFFAFYLARVGFEHERRERELAEAKVRAEHSSEQKSSFLANMSHEIRTPMNSILGFTELLASDIRDPRQQRYLLSIRTAAESLLQLINDVLDMSKIEAGVVELHPEPTDPREICDFIQTVFAEQATKKGLNLTCELAGELPRSLLLDRTRLRQVLVNLVGNAVKFTERGFVRLTVRPEQPADRSSRITLLVEVEDTGVGIPQDRLDVIFKPFGQADARRPQEKQGTGLGLAIVKRLTEMMGGSVVVASVPEQGTTFHLRIPNVTVSARLSVGRPSVQEGAVDFNELAPATIVVVDDNEMNRQLIAGVFEGSHHRIHFGANGLEAVSLTEALRPDVVLLDIRMPHMDGQEALAKIRATPGLEMVPVIVVTASSLMEDEHQLRQQFSGYVQKPFTRRALFEELAGFLQRCAPRMPEQESPPAGSKDLRTLDWADLSAELHKLEADEWPAVREGGAFNEAREFARQLLGLGEHGNCPPLVAYAQALQRSAEGYDVPGLEAELARFPQVISEIEARAVPLPS